MLFGKEIIIRFFDTIPTLFAQEQKTLDVQMFTPGSVNPETLVMFLGGVTFFVAVLVYGTHRYNRWKKFREFEDEMKSLDLHPEDEGTLAQMVKRFAMDEPINILLSPRLFDEMATKEISKVLGSAGSLQSKEKFIETVYRIRTKTYHTDWLRPTLEPAADHELSLDESFDKEEFEPDMRPN